MIGNNSKNRQKLQENRTAIVYREPKSMVYDHLLCNLTKKICKISVNLLLFRGLHFLKKCGTIEHRTRCVDFRYNQYKFEKTGRMFLPCPQGRDYWHLPQILRYLPPIFSFYGYSYVLNQTSRGLFLHFCGRLRLKGRSQK